MDMKYLYINIETLKITLGSSKTTTNILLLFKLEIISGDFSFRNNKHEDFNRYLHQYRLPILMQFDFFTILTVQGLEIIFL